MNSFNNEYKKDNKKEISIKKYLSKYEIDGEKIGGTIQTVYEEFAKNIPNFEELAHYQIKDFNNIFFLYFLSNFFIKSCSSSFWEVLGIIIKDIRYYWNDIFMIENNDKYFFGIDKKKKDYINYHLFYLNLYDLDILVQFMFNLSDFILNYLFPKKLIYFLPETFVTNISSILNTLTEISNFCNCIICINYAYEKKSENPTISNILSQITKIVMNLEKISKKTSYQYISIYIKIITDENIKKPSIKCICLDNIRKLLNTNDLLTNDDLFSVFNFINLVYNKEEYESSVESYMRIFENNMKLDIYPYYKFGQRLKALFSENINFLRNLIILLYSSLDKCLSSLEEAFSEYRFIPRNSQNQFNESIQNARNNISQNIIYSEGNNVIVINNNINNNYQINRNHIELINQALDTAIPIPERRLVVISNYDENEIEDRNKLNAISNALINLKSGILKINDFYYLTSNIKVFYQINTFENKKLYNLLSSLNNLLFSPINVAKIEKNRKVEYESIDITIKNSYKMLLRYVSEFYNILINNLIEINDENLFKNFCKQINQLKFKENLNIFEKFNPPIDNNDYKLLKDFISKSEKIVAEEDLKQNEINTKRENNSKEDNLCLICSDSVINSHLIPCNHAICRNCLYQQLFINRQCPFCRIEIKGIKEDPNFKI